VEQRGGFLTWLELTQFELEGQRLPLINQRGIHNPGYLDHTLSITSAVDGPYEDKIGPGGLLHYEFEAGDPLGGANRKLRQAMVHQVPFILFERPIANVYVPIFQAYAIDDDGKRATSGSQQGTNLERQRLQEKEPWRKATRSG